MLNVYIVRHGETDINKLNKINGSSMNLPLNETGIVQAQKLSASFDTRNIDVVYASPLKRAQQTAEIVDEGNHKIITDERLTEMNYGDWDGESVAEVRQKYPQVFDELGYFKENYSDYCSGESYAHLTKRLASFWQDLVHKYVAKSILLVFHGTASRSLVQYVLKVRDISAIGEVQNAGVINFAVDDQTKKPFLRYYNRVAPSKFLF